MSQAKVDRYKKEKKNRAKNIKRAKIKKVVGILVGAAFVGTAIGFPLGKHMYNVSVEERKANAVINTELYDYWLQKYWASNYSGIVSSDDLLSSNTDATTDSDATATEATTSDAE